MAGEPAGPDRDGWEHTLTRKGRWLFREPDPNAAARLFCFPFAGVGAAALRGWPGRIGEIEVCPVQPPGRENRMGEPAHLDFGEFAADAVDGMGEYLDRPFGFFGHCMGALLAHAVTDHLNETAGQVPDRLFVSSSYVPYLGVSKPFHPSMSDDELAAELKEISARMGDPDPLPELLELSVMVLRNDIDMCFEYAPPAKRLPCPISVIGWRADTIVPPADMAEWAEYGEVTEHLLDGDFFSFLSAPAALRDVITKDLKVTAGTRRTQ